MPELFELSKILLDVYRIPSITAYNRLEPTPRVADFDRSLKAEVRDPLWLLTRQWQFGEFQGEDAASPVTAQILGEHTVMDKVLFPGNFQFNYTEDVPLETSVEAEAIRPGLFLAVQMGRFFLKLMKKNSVEGHLPKFINYYPLSYPIPDNDEEAHQLLRAVSNKIFDGYLLLQDILTPQGATTKFRQWVTAQGIPEQALFNTISEEFKDWYGRSYSQPKEGIGSAWLPSQLEYQFQMTSSGQTSLQKHLVADQYYEGHLDWFSFDLKTTRERPAEEGTAVVENFVSFIPSPVSFKGMPNPRFWTMEEGQTDFGKIDTSPTGLIHFLFAEFGLIYSNDWFMLPYPLLINSLCGIKGIMITDVFGQHVLVRPAGTGKQSNWQKWSMFQHTDLNNSDANTNLFYLAPAVNRVVEGSPLEQVHFLRDEMANMVWGVETIVPSQSGKGVNGNEMVRKKIPVSPFVPVGNAAIRYVLGTTVPDNWTPFIPVHMEGSDSEIRLQRAKMPLAEGPFGIVLTEKNPPYYINEEEIPRSGVTVQRSYQRARWINGKTCLWIGRNKSAGKGEGWSNLKFDQLEDIIPKKE